MTFYLLLPGQSEADITDHNIIGELSFKSFHVGTAWNVLKKFIDQGNETVLNKLTIKDSSNKIWTVEALLSKLSSYHIVKY